MGEQTEEEPAASDQEVDEEPKEDEEPDAEEEAAEDSIEEHLKDAVEGSLRLKRLLTGEDDGGGDDKRRKLWEASPEVKEMAQKLLNKWQLSQDSGLVHLLENAEPDELAYLIKTNYVPKKGDAKRTPSEFTAAHIIEFRQQSLPVGSSLDIMAAFKFRHNMKSSDEAKLRGLTHKDLRYVLSHYDGTQPLDDIIAEAGGEVADEDGAENAMPGGPGVMTMGRFNRLELIDPQADAAVFGDANMTFSLSLAKHRTGLGHVGRVIATTFEEIDTLRERYKEIDASIAVLEEHDAEVHHGVDCTRIAVDERFKPMYGRLGAVYYNYPHSGAIPGFFDSHPMVNWRHENLMRLFFRALRSFVKPGGCVKVASNKGAVGVRYSYIVGGALENEFLHVETMPFMEWTLHRYGRSYGDRRDVYKRLDAKNNQSYAGQGQDRDMVYCFMYKPTGKKMGRQPIRPPPTLAQLQACKDGPFGKVSSKQAKEKLARELHERFTLEVTGTHVG